MADILPKATNNLVFVYGTLKTNEPNNKFWSAEIYDGGTRGSRGGEMRKHGLFQLLAKGETVHKLPLVVATKHNVPFLLHKPGDGHHVEGEIYCVDDKMMNSLDIFEDVPNYYKKIVAEIKVSECLNDKISLERGTIVKCSSYQLTNFKPELLKLRFYKTYCSAVVPPYTEMDEDEDDTEYYNEVLDIGNTS